MEDTTSESDSEEKMPDYDENTKAFIECQSSYMICFVLIQLEFKQHCCFNPMFSVTTNEHMLILLVQVLIK